MFNYSKAVIGITVLAATILPAFTFSLPAEANSTNGTYVIANNKQKFVESIVNNVPIPYGRVDAHGRVYRNGVSFGIIGVRATSGWRGAYGSVLIMGVDEREQVLFVKKVDAPTACGRYDSCRSKVLHRENFQINPKIAPYVKRIDLIVGERNGSRTLFQRISNQIKEAVDAYKGLPQEVKDAVKTQ